MKTFAILLLFVFLAAAPASAQSSGELDFLSGLTQFQRLREMLPSYLKGRARKLLDERARQVAAFSSAQDIERRGEYVREQMLEALGGFPERTPLNPRLVGVIDRGDYKIEKLIFESQPQFYVTANLYLPKTGEPPYPAVLFAQGHDPGGKAYHVSQTMLGTLAKRGYVSLIWDPIGQGERLQFYDEDLKRSKVVRMLTEHTMPGLQCLLVGDSLARYMIWDGVRALDYLLSREEVDSTRIAATGNSGGGAHVAYQAALDSRIHVAAPSCWVNSWMPLLDALGPQDPEQILLPWLRAGLDYPDFLYAFAPKPYLILAAIRDFFPIGGVRQTFREAKQIYELLGAEDKLHKVEGDHRHLYSQTLRMAAYDWLSLWLKGRHDREPEPEVAYLSEEELECTETGQLATSLGGETVFTLNQKRAKQLDKKLPPVSGSRDYPAYREAIRSRVKKLSGFERSSGPVRTESYGEIERGRYRIERLTYESEPGILIPSLLFVPKSADERKPAVVYIHGEGKAADGAPGGPIESLAHDGYVVLAIDARGLGETRLAEDSNGSDFPRHFGLYDSTTNALLIGESLVGMRALDISRAVDLLAARSEVDAGRISGIGKQLGAIPLLYAAVMDERLRGIVLEESLVSYEAVVSHAIHRGVYENFVFGALAHFDLPDLVAALAPRGVTMVSPADPLGLPLDLERARRAYSPAIQTYQVLDAAGSIRVIRDGRPGRATYSEWLGP